MREKPSPAMLNKVLRWIDISHKVVLTLLVGILAAGVSLTVALRYIFGLSAAWAEELLTMVFIATTFIGASLDLREKEHIAMSALADSLPTRPRRFASITVMVVIIVLSVFVIAYSTRWISIVGGVPSVATGIKYGWFYLLMPLTFALTAFYAVVNILAEFMNIDPPVTKSDFTGLENAGTEDLS